MLLAYEITLSLDSPCCCAQYSVVYVQLVRKLEVFLLYRGTQNGKLHDNFGPGLMPKSLLLVQILTKVVDVRQIIATLSKDRSLLWHFEF